MLKTKEEIASECARRASKFFARAGVQKSSLKSSFHSPRGSFFIRFTRAGKALKNNAVMVRALHKEPNRPDTNLNFVHYSEPIKEFLLKKLGGLTAVRGMNLPHLVVCCPTMPDSSAFKKDEGAIIDIHWLDGKPEKGSKTTSMFGFRLLFVDKGVIALEFLKGMRLAPVKLQSTQKGRDAREKDEERRIAQAKYGAGVTSLINHARATVAPCVPLPLKPQRTNTAIIEKELKCTLPVPHPPEPERTCSLAAKMESLCAVSGLPAMPPSLSPLDEPSLQPPPIKRQ